MTPPVPSWMQSFTLTGYRNIYELCPDEPRIYGTESLYGDWDAPVLLLAKDFACSKLVHDRMNCGDQRPFRHEPGLKTNRRLAQLVAPFRRSPDPTSCGLLYGSALAGLLRDDDAMSGSLPNRHAALSYGSRVLAFVIANMPNLETVVCMGQEAWQAASQSLNHRTPWTNAIKIDGCVQTSGPDLCAVFHPAARVSNDRMRSSWSRIGLPRRRAA